MDLKQGIIERIEKDFSKLEELHSLSFDEILRVLKRRHEDRKNKSIPVSIFNNKKLSGLEAVVKFLKEKQGLNYKEIAFLLNRNYDPIAITYRRAKRELSGSLDYSSEENIPIEIFCNKKLSVLENITHYLKDSLNLRLSEIASILNRDDRTIWTVYSRIKKKYETK